MSEKTDIKSMDLEELKTFFSDMGEKAFRAKQVYEWLHVRQVESFEEMTNLSKTLRERLDETCRIITLRKEQVQISKLDGTRKYLFLLEDGNVIESVLMKYKHGNSVCISSQVGCRMGCRFCASTLDGLVRGLAPAEMLDQIYQIGKDIGERISNVVVMGTGEPMDNFDNLVKFITLLTDENGLHISQRNLTVSTCGIVPRMRELADKKLAITLALSLHASNQKKRLELMPVANKYDIHEVIDACRYYFEQTGRRITFEYSLVGGVNDTEGYSGAGRRGKECPFPNPVCIPYVCFSHVWMFCFRGFASADATRGLSNCHLDPFGIVIPSTHFKSIIVNSPNHHAKECAND